MTSLTPGMVSRSQAAGQHCVGGRVVATLEERGEDLQRHRAGGLDRVVGEDVGVCIWPARGLIE